MTADGFNAKNYETAYLPFASFGDLEGLPLNAGITVAQSLGEEISSRISAFMLPVQPFAGAVQGGKFGLNVDPLLLYDMGLDLAREVKRQRFNKLVLHQGFSGMSMLYPLTRHLNANEGIKTVFVRPCENVDFGAIIAYLNGIGGEGAIFTNLVESAVKHINEAFAFMAANGNYTGGREIGWRERP